MKILEPVMVSQECFMCFERYKGGGVCYLSYPSILGGINITAIP